MKINNWSVCFDGSNPYQAPELQVPRLAGSVENHPRLGKRDDILTSAIIGKRNGLVVTKSGSEYELGEVDAGYEKEYPNAKERLMKSLAEV